MTTPTPAATEDVAEQVLFEGRPALIGGVGALLITILTVGLALIVFWFRARAVHYRITTQRVVIERGVLSKKLEQTDLYRVYDYVVERPLSQRMLGTGNLVLESADKSTPKIRIDGIKTDVVALYEQVRKATEVEKRRRGVRVVDAET